MSVPAIEVDSLTKRYDSVTAIEDISFTIDSGELVGILGPNGAGKTTLIKSILGLVVPSSGNVRIAGIDARERPRRVYRHVGAMLEGARNVYWRLTVRENLAFFGALGGQDPDAARDRHDRLLEQFGLADKADVPVNDLSRGQKQKVSLASTLARGTDVVFLDEPTLGLDVEASLELRRELSRLAEEEAITVVLSSHDMDVVEDVCDRVVILSDGGIIADDAVDDLVSVFDTKAYRITVNGSVPEEVRASLTSSFHADGFEAVGDQTRFEVRVDGDTTLYQVTDALREPGLELVDIDRHDPDLEEVFLDVTNNRIRGDAA